jgi:hypothetical protein
VELDEGLLLTETDQEIDGSVKRARLLSTFDKERVLRRRKKPQRIVEPLLFQIAVKTYKLEFIYLWFSSKNFVQFEVWFFETEEMRF